MNIAPIAQQQDAGRFSTRDRESAANLLLNAACRQAIAMLELGRRHNMDCSDTVRRRLTIAAQKAERILGSES